MNSGTYQWQIEPNLFKQILRAKRGDKFESNAFQIGQLNWKIQLCPKGWNTDDKNKHLWFAVYVKLLGMPSSWKSILFQLHIECPQMHHKMIFMQPFTDPHRY
eukprot:184520_1